MKPLHDEDVTCENDKYVQSAIDAYGTEVRDNTRSQLIAIGKHVEGESCDEEKCQECCPHDERDHGICLDCEHEEDPGAAIDRAMDSMEDR